MNTPPAVLALSFTLLSLAPLQPLQAQTQDAAALASQQGAAYTTVAGDTLEKIAAKHYPDSPLQMVLLVRHVQEANADVLGKTSARQKLKTGTRLRIPEHARLVQQSLAPFLPVHEDPALSAQSPEARRRWVHYP